MLAHWSDIEPMILGGQRKLREAQRPEDQAAISCLVQERAKVNSHALSQNNSHLSKHYFCRFDDGGRK